MKPVYPRHNSHGGLSGLSVLVLLMLCLFLFLGGWQLARKAEKEDILNSVARSSELAIQQLPENLADYTEWRYRAVHAAGEYLVDQQFLLDNQIRDRLVGYNILTPLRLASGKFVLVDRGWLPQAAQRTVLPEVDVSSAQRSVSGELYTPFGDGVRLGSVDNGMSGWPRVIQYIDYAQLAEQLQQPVLPVVLRLAPEQPDGYRRDWAKVAFGPERHLGYAVQWFGLAFAMAIIFIILVRKSE